MIAARQRSPRQGAFPSVAPALQETHVMHFRISLTCAVLAGAVFGARAGAVEPWADPGMKLTQGPELWLDAAKINAARKARGLLGLKPGESVEVWPDASGNKLDVAQREPS